MCRRRSPAIDIRCRRRQLDVGDIQLEVIAGVVQQVPDVVVQTFETAFSLCQDRLVDLFFFKLPDGKAGGQGYQKPDDGDAKYELAVDCLVAVK